MFERNFFLGKKVFVTGHTGFKGAWLCMMLSRLGADIYGYALKSPTSPSLFDVADVESLLKKSIIGDIRNYGFLKETLADIAPEIIIHMAAQPLVRESYINPVETYDINVMGTVNLLEAVRYTDSVKAVVNVTTDKCYENKEWYWGYRENEPMGGYDPYSNSKSCSELVTSSFRNSFFNPSDFGTKHHVALASARAGNVIGGGDWAEDRLIPDFIRSITTNQTVKIRNPYAIRPWQHVLEPLSGYLTLAYNLYKDGCKYAAAWNFGPEDQDAKNVEWVIAAICRLWGDNANYKIDASPQPHEAGYLKLDCSKAKALLNWYPQWDIQTALEKVVSWTQCYLSGKNMRECSAQQIEEYLK